MKRGATGTAQQQVFDAIGVRNGATCEEIVNATGLSPNAVRNALTELRRTIRLETCKSPTRYRIKDGTSRPKDGRGRKP